MQILQAIEASASPNIKVLVVGNPANTNARICAKYAPKVRTKPVTDFVAVLKERLQF